MVSKDLLQGASNLNSQTVKYHNFQRRKYFISLSATRRITLHPSFFSLLLRLFFPHLEDNICQNFVALGNYERPLIYTSNKFSKPGDTSILGRFKGFMAFGALINFLFPFFLDQICQTFYT